jgi:hypothetical protein
MQAARLAINFSRHFLLSLLHYNKLATVSLNYLERVREISKQTKLRNNFKKVHGIRWCNFQEFLRDGNFSLISWFVALVMRSQENVPKNGIPTVVFSCPTMPASHRSVIVQDFLAKNNVTTLEHLSYSPDLAAAVFCLFHPMKSVVSGHLFLIPMTSLRMRRLS